VTNVSLVHLERYLEETRPFPRLLPEEPWKRCKVREVVETINSGIQPLQNAPVVAAIAGSDVDRRTKWAADVISKGLSTLERQAEENLAHDFLFDWSTQPTLAEVFLVPQLYNASTRYGIGLSAYPRIARVFNHMMTNFEAFRATMPPSSL